MAKTKILLATGLSVLTVGAVVTASVIVTKNAKNKKDNTVQKTPEQITQNSEVKYELSNEQKDLLNAKFILHKGKEVTVVLSNSSGSAKTIKTKIKEDGTVDFSSLKDGKTYNVAKIIVKDGEKESDLIDEVKTHNDGSNTGGQSGNTTKPADPINGDGKKPGDTTRPMEPIQGDDPSVGGSSEGPKDPAAPAEEGPKDPATPAEEGPKDPAAPAEEGPKDPVAPAEEGPKDPATPAEEGPKDPVAPAEEGPKDTATPAEEGPKDPVAPAEEGPKDPVAPAEEGPKDPVAPAEEGPKDPAAPAEEGPKDTATTSES
ncbi:hypothetical protein [Mycoplasmopsis bovigenitalium]|uniref:hypothetical protein n=1 Tax=Mycoplasmopsis bovigenitalium TaxID=2112 RepID=UPI000BBB15FC|nr:hypothetical protein [Mycoplasmopsis bovigenitalium]